MGTEENTGDRRGEVGTHKRPVDDIEEDCCEGDNDVGFGTGRCAQWEQDSAIGVVDAVEEGEDGLGRD